MVRNPYLAFAWPSSLAGCIQKAMSDVPSPLVTIGLPVYNGATYLKATLDALLSQDYPRFRVVISDNCSTDATRRICLDFASLDDRVRYYRNARNLGAAGNFNRVVELAEGKYFAWANHDDLWGVNYVSRCVSALEERPEAVLAYARSAKIDGTGTQVAPLLEDLGLEGGAPVERLRRYHDLFIEIDEEGRWSTDAIEGLWIPVYGVIRAEELRATGMIGSYISSDTILLEELLMRGAFAEVEDRLFFKRDHEERSMRASVSYDKRIDWFTGQKAGVLIFPRWRLLIERLRAVGRAPLNRSSRSACYREMAGFYLRRPHEGRALVKELLVNGARATRPLIDRLHLLDDAALEKW